MDPIPEGFHSKKSRILQSLAVPEEEYLDHSPKGSVDEGIKDLIAEINSMSGYVTTSSCAGRISVFLEGRKMKSQQQSQDSDHPEHSHTPVPGGKGLGGRWLFVSHDPVASAASHDLCKTFQMSSSSSSACRGLSLETRFVKFQFEPMILHVMAASLQHAQTVLSAAINAGFRESGVQSLRNLSDANAFPMVAVRTSGLALSSLIGFVDEMDDSEEHIFSMVDESYLQILLTLANERFVSNSDRIERFRRELAQAGHKAINSWEDKDARRERKKALGLEKKALVHRLGED